MNTVVVIARNLDEFRRVKEERAMKANRWLYISSPEQLHGLRNYSVVRYGQWYARPDLDKIEELLKYAKLAGDIVK